MMIVPPAHQDPELHLITVKTSPAHAQDEDLFATARSCPERNIGPGKKQKFADFPSVGATLENCLLVAELGRGASGQAFLALQITLANRPIVLKISTAAARAEDLNLARLQHTHIMPLYWASKIGQGGLHVLAMPFLARTTLARLLVCLQESPKETWNGQRLFDILQNDQACLPIRIALQEHPAQFLKQSTWVDFVVRMGQTLAEALAYAHQRGLLHLDLKPANILITPDGQPILLDLDVACPPIPAGTTSVPWLGGTEGFMAPEQRAAMAALANQQAIPLAVDGRADLYSLGLVLYSALGGQINAQYLPNPLGLPRQNPQVSPGLASILARCLSDAPTERYADGNALAEDLRRHLESLPLRGVRNRLSERWRKWRRRRPLSLPLFLLLVGFCITAGVAGFNVHLLNKERHRQAETALAEGQEWQRKGQYEAAIRRFLAGKEFADQTPGDGLLRTQLTRHLLQAQRLQKAGELSKVVQLMRFYTLQEHTPRRLQHVLEAAGRKLWADRELLIDASAGKLDIVSEKNINAQLQELVYLWSDLQVRLAPATHVDIVRSENRKMLSDAERLFGPSFGLSLARAHLGETANADVQPQETWEFCALGGIALDKGDYAGAGNYMQQALDRDPQGFVANFYFGINALRQKKYAPALQAFSFCAGQEPYPECFLLRGQVLAALGEAAGALKDFNHALEKNSELGIAYLHRGHLFREWGRWAEAEKDFRMASTFLD